MPDKPRSEPLLTVERLDVTYRSEGGRLLALDDVNFSAESGEIIGIVGESGCGKSTLSAALMGLLAANGEVTRGHATLRGRDLVSLPPAAMRKIRGREISMVFQDPLTSLNPTFTIGTQMLDVLKAHTPGRFDKAVARQRCIEMLERVGIPDVASRLASYQHEFSGGQRQRVMIAIALLLEPSLLIADEITSALDVTLESQIIQLLLDLRAERGTTILFIAHDLGVVAQLCDRVIVMYAGRAIEEAPVDELFAYPRHPYTRALIGAVPSRVRRGTDLVSIPGRVPALAHLVHGCSYADRCEFAQPVCSACPVEIRRGRTQVRCHGYDPSSGYDNPWPFDPAANLTVTGHGDR